MVKNVRIKKIDDTVSVTSKPTSQKIIALPKPKKEVHQQITLEFLNLKAPYFGGLKKTNICLLCLSETFTETNIIITCAGSCSQTFHINCMKLLLDYLTINEVEKPALNYNKCVDCNHNQRRCFMCRKLSNKSSPTDMVKCSHGQCGRYYHRDCLNNGVYHNLVTHNRLGNVTCPSHTCHSCHLENPATVRHTNAHIRCIMCPAAYHKGDWCIPAGSKEINSFFMICPQHLQAGGSYDMSIAPFMNCVKNDSVTLQRFHFKITPFNDPENSDLWILDKPLRSSRTKPVNVTWCFICSKGGDLICCEKCPASLHQHCAQIKEIPESFVCDECEMGKYPRYGEILWLKIGAYRWWPAQVIHPRNAPAKILNSSHSDGHFLVLFFGTNDYHWCNKTQAFMFDEGDDESSVTNDNSSSDENDSISTVIHTDNQRTTLEKAYKISLKLAGKVFRRRIKKWNELISNGNKPTHYRTIKNNIPVGKVRMNKIQDVSEIHQCECRLGVGKNDTDPCGATSECINRQLNYECNPVYCRNGTNCRNQRFMLRQYPSMEIFSSEDRGWGLKTKQNIKQGAFVIEYVGEVIDEEESNRRLKTAHENNVTNFYMMELDSQRIIDAGPAANVSRFMNHSCSPNVFTQRWQVNGDIRIGLFALNDIDANEELTFNYNFTSFGEIKIPCKCGSSNCSGFLGVPPKVMSSSSDLASLDNHDVPSIKAKPAKKNAARTDRRPPKTKRGDHDNAPPIKKVTLDSGVIAKSSASVKCFVCHETDCEVRCGLKDCPQMYHLRCLDLREPPPPLWFCPWHHCDDCGRIAVSHCAFCTMSLCGMHVADRVVPCVPDGPLGCLDHAVMYRAALEGPVPPRILPGTAVTPPRVAPGTAVTPPRVAPGTPVTPTHSHRRNTDSTESPPSNASI